MSRIVVAIPTFRRPELLTVLLDSLALELAGRDIPVLIGDNDCDEAIVALLAGRAAPAALTYRAIRDRGVAQVRNSLVDAATSAVPDWRWLVMLDDDGMVTPGWLDAIVAAGDRLDADLIGGPVEGVLPPGAGALARNSVFARRRRWPTGEVEILNTTQNLAIRRSLVERVGLPLFDLRYGASGGEDYDLFRRTRRAGGRLAWCDEAVVIEPAPPERLTVRALLHRYYSTGVYMGPIDRGYDGVAHEVFGTAKGLVRGTIEAALGGLTGRRDTAARGILMTAHHLGRLSSLTGIRSRRYVAAEPVS